MKHKIIYFFTALLTVFCGLLVRAKRAWLPEYINFWLGDALYAFMIYYLVSVLPLKLRAKTKFTLAFLLCCCVELSQLYQAEWINMVRHTLPGRLILGSGFLWSDIAAYLTGVAAACCVDILWLSPNKTTA